MILLSDMNLMRDVWPLINDLVLDESYSTGYELIAGSLISCLNSRGEYIHESFSRIYLSCGGDVGLYQMFSAGEDVVVADYHNEHLIYSRYNKCTSDFNREFDVGLSFKVIKDILEILESHQCFAFLTVGSKMINHWSLMKRKDWNDRKVKRYFYNVEFNKNDRDKHYPLVEVLKIERNIKYKD